MTSRWIRRVEELGGAEVEWGVFSLEIKNNERGAAGVDVSASRGIPALRTALAVRDRHGNPAMGKFYAALGHRIHEGCEHASDPVTIKGALDDCGLDAGLFDEAQADDATWQLLVREHDALAAETGAFGVPVVRLASGRAIFGPVISELPDDEHALELFRSTVFLTDYANFAEFKRDRTVPLDLERVRRRAAEQAAKASSAPSR